MDDRPGTVARRRVPELDGLRGIAIGMVLLRHAKPQLWGAAGMVGVELFFVLSGYLITSILLAGIARGGLSLRRFYANRALRLVPALVLVVGVVVPVVVTVNPAGDAGELVDASIVALTYTSDIAGLPVFRELDHLWSLAIEEQFYLLWPLLLLVYVARRPGRRAGVVLAVAAAAMAITVLGHESVGEAYIWPTTWACTLVAGCALACGTVRVPASPRAGTLALAALCVLALVPGAKTGVVGYFVVLPAAALCAVILIASAVGPRSVPVLRNRALQWLGTVSYGAYLWNFPMLLWFGGKASIPLTILCATLSYYVVERRFLRLKRRSTEPAALPRAAVTAP